MSYKTRHLLGWGVGGRGILEDRKSLILSKPRDAEVLANAAVCLLQKRFFRTLSIFCWSKVSFYVLEEGGGLISEPPGVGGRTLSLCSRAAICRDVGQGVKRIIYG